MKSIDEIKSDIRRREELKEKIRKILRKEKVALSREELAKRLGIDPMEVPWFTHFEQLFNIYKVKIHNNYYYAELNKPLIAFYTLIAAICLAIILSLKLPLYITLCLIIAVLTPFHIFLIGGD